MSAPQQLLSNRYELGETLGYGGMSEVHHGRDVRLGRDVAVKVLRADLARDAQFQERFRREAQNAAALNHPAIVAVYDTGETRTEYGPLPYIVMEYVDGRTLRDIVKGDGPLSGKRAMEVMADVSAALDYSHRHGIVHRDVKPANVMITRNGAVKVMDFGIARALADGQAAVTQTAAVIGTAQYLSPEQARGESVDARSDVYSAGCVLYELLTGQPPFTGDSPVAVAYQHVREDPEPPSAVNGQVSPELDAIVLKSLAKNPANRYQSAAEMRSDLVKVLSGARPSAPMVMTDEDRTSLMTGAAPAAYAGDLDDYDDDYYDPEEEERRRRRRKGWKRVGIVALCLAVLAGAAWLTTALLGGPNSNKIAVPSLVGQSQPTAIQTLNSKNLRPNFKRLYCETQANGRPGPCTRDQVGKVVRTNPEEGTDVKPTSTVAVFMGTAPRKERLPDLKGQTPQQARVALNRLGLQVSNAQPKLQPTDDESLIGKVINTAPGSGSQVERGSKVSFIVGKEIPKVTVSDFTGQPYDQAASNLQGLGLQVDREDVDSTEPANTVVDQDPKGGEVPKGDTVTLSVSKGNQFEMPDIEGKTQDEAQKILSGEQWTGSFNVSQKPVDDSSKVGKIVSSDPSAGDDVGKSDSINIVVGKNKPKPKPTPPPNQKPKPTGPPTNRPFPFPPGR